MDEVTPFMFKIGEQNVIVENSADSIKLVTEFLKKNTPKLDEYFHKEWTQETHDKVADAVIACIGNKAVIKMILDRTKDTVTKGIIEAKLNGKQSVSATPVSTPSKAASIDDGLEFTSASVAVETTATPAQTDEYDALFGDL